MAYEIPGQQVSFQAAADLSAKQYCADKMDDNRQIAANSAVTERPQGILQDKPAAQGRAGCVMLDGISKMVGGGNLAKGDLVGVDAQGRAVAVVPGTDTTKYIIGTVLEDNSVAGGLITVQFDCKNPSRAA
jgi:hypothetical protein